MVGACGQLGMGYGMRTDRGRHDVCGRHDGNDRGGWRRSASPPPEPPRITAGTSYPEMLCSNAIEPDAEVIKYMFKYNDKNRCLVVSRLSDGSEGLGR